VEADSRGRESVSKRKGHDRALAELTRAAATFPELRIGQLIMNATGKMDIFYVRDEDLARDLVKFREKQANILARKIKTGEEK